MKALLFGSSGLTGSHLFRLLLENPVIMQLTTVGRQHQQPLNPKHSHLCVEFEKLAETSVFMSVDVVFCCLGTTIAKAKTKENFERVDLFYPLEISRLAQMHGIKQLIIISSMGANAASPNFYLRTKGKMEAGVASQFTQKLSFMRPGLILGKRAEFRFGEKVASVLFPLINPLFIGNLGKYRAVNARKIAAAMLQLVFMDKPPQHCSSREIEILSEKYFLNLNQ